MIEWPTTLPDFVLRAGYAEGFKNLVIRTKMDTGATKRRRRFSDGPEAHKFPMHFTSAELDIFKDFFENTISSGALSFQRIHPRTNVIETWAFTEVIPPVKASGPDTYDIILPLEKLQ